VSGALAERDFVAKLERAGFSEIEVLAREPLSIDDCALYPLFDGELLALMRSVIDPDKQHAVGIGVIFRARRERKVSGVLTRLASA
jgi:arsenite methyltransferase